MHRGSGLPSAAGQSAKFFIPRADYIALRDAALIVTGPDGFFSDERYHTESSTSYLTLDGIPAFRVENRCLQGRYQLIKQVIADPRRDVLLQQVRFEPWQSAVENFRLFVILSPCLGNQGSDNSGWLDSFRHQPMLLARGGLHCLAAATSASWVRRSVGYVGVSDPWQDLYGHGGITRTFDQADHGHVAIAGEIDLVRCGGEFILALSFDDTPEGAALNATLSLSRPFDATRQAYVEEWNRWLQNRERLDAEERGEWAATALTLREKPDQSRPRAWLEADRAARSLYRTSLMSLRVHRAKRFTGGGVASLSVPWGASRPKDAGGYHITWVRDLVEEACGFLAAGKPEETRDALDYLKATQLPAGGWPQNMWLDGAAYGGGMQLDEAALPTLLVDLGEREGVLNQEEVKAAWPMVQQSSRFLIARGPSTGQDRWENAPGLSPFTLATEVAALLIAARLAEQFDDALAAQYFRETADLWNDLIEEWTYVRRTPLAKRIGVDGYYIRIAPSPGIAVFANSGHVPRSNSAPRDSGGRSRQSRCAGTCQVRSAGCRRSADSQHFEGDRRH